MLQAPRSLQRQLSSISLASLYAIASSLPAALILWFVQGNAAIPHAFSQTQPGDSPPESPNPAAQQLLEDARQRLIQRGELPGRAPTPIPSVPRPLPGEVEFDRYRLGPGDSLFVNVLRFPDLSFQGTLDLQGNMIFPLIGSLPLAGLTISQAQGLIQSRFNEFIINPEVDLTLVAQRPVQVTVLGEIVRPGLYPLPAPQISVALISAGGTTNLADLRTVRIRRTLLNGNVLERNVDLFTPLQTAGALPDIRVEDGDTIIVPTLTAAASQTYDRSLIARSTLAQQQINVRFLNYAGGRDGGNRGGGGGNLGNIALPNGSTFLDAITAISPNPDRAALRDVALIRFDIQQGKAIAQELNSRNALRGDISQNPLLENNDVIIIGRNFVNRITYALNTFTQPFRDVLGFLLFFDTLTDTASDLFGPGDDDDDDDDD